MEPRFPGSALSKKDMVSLSQRAGITLQANADIELREFYAFVFGESVDLSAQEDVPHLNLLRTIANRDKTGFQQQISDLERRRINDDSVWFENDSLVFLILVGSEMFEIRTELMEKVLSAREKNTNPAARKVNQVFRALSRREYGMEGEYCFLKVVFLELIGRLKLTDQIARQAYLNLTRPGLLDELSPFHQILAIRAFDLILLNREPNKFESYPQILEGIERLHDKLSFRQAVRLLFVLPAKLWLAAIPILLGLLVFIFGVGQKSADRWWNREQQRKLPALLSTTKISEASAAGSKAIRELSSSLVSSHQAPTGSKLLVTDVDTSDFGTSTPAFTVELSHVSYPVVDGYAFAVNKTEGGEIFGILPVQKTNVGLRAVVPKSDDSTRIVFVVLLEVPISEDPRITKDQFVLHSYR